LIFYKLKKCIVKEYIHMEYLLQEVL